MSYFAYRSISSISLEPVSEKHTALSACLDKAIEATGALHTTD